MRIVSGEFGGRKLHVPKGNDVRPTSDKVRGAIFNALNSRIDLKGAYVLDVFCGTGALGLEALSRGAANCTFIDKARSSIDLAKQNADDLGAEAVKFLLKEAVKIGPRPESIEAVNLVFIDPPYEQDLIAPTLEALSMNDWLAANCMLVLESEKGFTAPLPEGFLVLDERDYKDTKITYVSYSNPE